MPDLRANLRFVAKVVLATLLLGVLAGVAGSQIVPGWSLVRVLLSSALGAAALLGVLVVATIAKLVLGQFILRKGGTDVQWFWFSGEPLGLEHLRGQGHAPPAPCGEQENPGRPCVFLRAKPGYTKKALTGNGKGFFAGAQPFQA